MSKKTALAITAAAGAAAHIGFSCLTFYEVFGRNASLPGMINEKQKKIKGDGNVDPRVKWMHAQKFKEYFLTNEKGIKLCGYYLPSETPSNKFVLCAHGYRSRGSGEFRFVSKFYHENGFNIFLVDHRASGDSEGNTITFGKYESEDLLRWSNFLIEEFGDEIEIMLHGISMGAATTLLLCGNDKLSDKVKFAVADCSYASVVGQFTDVLKSAKVPSTLLINTVDVINRVVNGFSFRSVKPVDAVKNAQVPILFIHGTKDGFVPVKNVFKLYDACSSEKDMLLVTGAGHSASYRKNTPSYEAKVLEFTKKYMSE